MIPAQPEDRFVVEVEKIGKWSVVAKMLTEYTALEMFEAAVKASFPLRARVIDPKSEIIALDAMGTVPKLLTFGAR